MCYSSCAICIAKFEEGEEIKTLVCFHKFHSHCIDDWLKRNGICPICRERVNIGNNWVFKLEKNNLNSLNETALINHKIIT